MGEVVSFRRKRLSGFIPEEKTDQPEPFAWLVDMMFGPPGPLPKWPSDPAPSEPNPDSGDCA